MDLEGKLIQADAPHTTQAIFSGNNGWTALLSREHPVETWGSGGLDAYSRFLDICFDPPFQQAFHRVWSRKAASDRRG